MIRGQLGRSESRSYSEDASFQKRDRLAALTGKDAIREGNRFSIWKAPAT
jgi:hypothetical protein